MAKGKKNGKVQSKALYSRISFLQQAATLLSVTRAKPTRTVTASPPEQQDQLPPHTLPNFKTSLSGGHDAPRQSPILGMARRLAGDLRSVSNKMRIRLSPAAKQAVCRFCDSVLVEGRTCTSLVENHSKGGRKPWADVLVRRCHACGRERRYPVSARRQRRKTERGDTTQQGALRAGGQEEVEHELVVEGAG